MYRVPCIASPRLHVGHVQDALVVPSHKAGFIYLVGEEFDLKAGREVERAVREAPRPAPVRGGGRFWALSGSGRREGSEPRPGGYRTGRYSSKSFAQRQCVRQLVQTRLGPVLGRGWLFKHKETVFFCSKSKRVAADCIGVRFCLARAGVPRLPRPWLRRTGLAQIRLVRKLIAWARVVSGSQNSRSKRLDFVAEPSSIRFGRLEL